MFRSVELPARIPGKLLVHSMPGRYELLDRAWQQVRGDNVSVIVCLAEKSEIHQKSPEYAEALLSAATPCPVIAFEVPDRGAPDERDRFWQLARQTAERLRGGETILVHCAGGVGRTGMFAICVLLALGENGNAARSSLARAGSTVETAAQSALIAWCIQQAGNGR